MKTFFFNPKTLMLPFVLLLLPVLSHSQVPLKYEGPYFQVESKADVEAFPLKKTDVKVNILNSIAHVSVEQVYVNEGSKTIEAIYVFPGSTQSAIHSMRMIIGERVIQAKIAEKSEARKNYEQAKSDGKSASLLEQHRPNVFQMNVANILPGDVIKVQLQYTEFIESAGGEYAFVYPTVVGPRYQSPELQASAGEQWNGNPYLKKDKPIPYEFSLTGNIQSAVPIASAACKSHDTQLQFTSKHNATIQLNRSDEGNRDFILKYRLQGDKIESGLMVFPSDKETFFMAVMEPPAQVKKSDFTPREFVFVLDISGSMNGFPIETSKELITGMIDELSDKDYFNILTFAGTSMTFSDKPSVASIENKQRAKSFINTRNSGGGTELLPALRRVFSLPKQEGLSRSIVIATDGYVTVEKECFELIDQKSAESNIHTFGIGSSVNRYLLEGMGKIGKGYHTVITDAKDARKEASKFRNFIDRPLLTDIKVSLSGVGKVDLEPSSITDLLADRPIVIAGRVEGPVASGILRIEGNNGREKFEKTFSYSNAQVSKDFEALRYLWARKRIQRLDDYTYLGKQEQNNSEVLALGLKYNLLTAYTSFLAVDSEVRNRDMQYATVTQPLPLPKNVEESAVMSAQSIVYSKPMRATQVQGLATRDCEMDFNTTQKTTYKAGRDLPPHKYDERKRNYGIDHVEEESFEVKNPHLKTKTADLDYFRMVFPTEKLQQKPSFKKGREDFDLYLCQNLKYPDDARKSGIKGNVVVIAEIDEQGKISNVSVKKGVHPSLDKEAVRLISTMPNWNAARYGNKPIACRIELVVSFS